MQRAIESRGLDLSKRAARNQGQRAQAKHYTNHQPQTKLPNSVEDKLWGVVRIKRSQEKKTTNFPPKQKIMNIKYNNRSDKENERKSRAIGLRVSPADSSSSSSSYTVPSLIRYQNVLQENYAPGIVSDRGKKLSTAA